LSKFDATKLAHPIHPLQDVRNASGVVVGREIRFRDAPGGSVIQRRANDPRIQERVPVEEDIRVLRIATSVLGDGFVESIPDSAITAVRNDQAKLHPDMLGFAVCDSVAADVKRDAAGNPILEDGQPKDFVFQARVGENSRSFYERWEVIFAAHYRDT
jgi:hypothetical protein